ncbi:MAG: bifunctional 4-hydroxy-2-oxoglutarate aldolase/2-dehydro-3-deoxy-phosphogluconate aldolase [Sphingomonadales bacterium]|nr:bifunctional 4-hydroxy-2-oxoglutarate aldolase/2-dehydro-3-deoxy-phosphogluconate aldolase [Sphingomonadales bacterium]
MSQLTVLDLLTASPIVAVLTIERPEDAVPLAEAMVAGGITGLEVTLRTDCALDCISAIAANVPDALIGAGTVLTPAHLQQVIDAGAQFGISPGTTAGLLAAASTAPIPFLPGVATSSEIMYALDAGFDIVKFFPVTSLGGVGAIKTIGGPFPQVRFCCNGGTSGENYLDFLNLANVLAVGGSWVAPAKMIADKDWAGITELARRNIGPARDVLEAA